MLSTSYEMAYFAKGDIKVSGTKITSRDQVDIEGPTIDVNSIKVDKKEAVQGDKVKVSLSFANFIVK